MNDIKAYLISICAAAVCCGIITKLVNQKGSSGALIKFLCGIFMLVTFLSPAISLPIFDLQLYLNQLSYEAERISAEGEASVKKETDRVMQQQIQAYILEKASTLGAEVDVQVTVKDGIPCAVTVSGAVSPYTKNRLSDYIEDQLGISTEDQLWNT